LRQEQVKRVLIEGKAGVIENDIALADEEHEMLGSLGVITGKDMRGDRHLPFWLEQGIESSLRNTEEDIPVVPFTAMSSAQVQRSLGSHIGSPTVLTPTESISPAGPGIHGGSKGPWTDLDKFYEEDSEEEETESSDETEDDNVGQDDEEDDDEEDDDDESKGTDEQREEDLNQ